MTARIKTCFQVTPEDAREMAYLFVGGEAECSLKTSTPSPLSTCCITARITLMSRCVWSGTYCRCRAKSIAASIEITHPGFRSEHIGYWMLNVEAPKDKPRVADPTPYLNHLLYQVMKTGNAEVHIPDRDRLWLRQLRQGLLFGVSLRTMG